MKLLFMIFALIGAGYAVYLNVKQERNQPYQELTSDFKGAFFVVLVFITMLNFAESVE